MTRCYSLMVLVMLQIYKTSIIYGLTRFLVISLHLIPNDCTVCNLQLLRLISEQLPPIQRELIRIPVGFVLLEHTIEFFCNYQSKYYCISFNRESH